MYACAVGDVGCFRRFALRFGAPPEVRVTSVLAQLAADVGIDDIVDALYRDTYALFPQYSTDLFRRPQMIGDHLFYPPYKNTVKLSVGCSAFAAIHRFGVSFLPKVVSLGRGISTKFAAKR